MIEQRLGDVIFRAELPRLRRGEAGLRTYRLPTSRSGTYSVGPVEIPKADPFGLCRRVRALGEPQVISVHPRALSLSALPSGMSRNLEGPSSDTSPQGSVTFHRLREYVIGDDLRTVHWPSTARLGKLVVRHNVDTAQPYTVVLVDIRPEVYSSETFEEAMDVTASVATSLSAGKAPVQIRTTAGERVGGAGRRDPAGLVDYLTDLVPSSLGSLSAQILPLRRDRGGSAACGGNRRARARHPSRDRCSETAFRPRDSGLGRPPTGPSPRVPGSKGARGEHGGRAGSGMGRAGDEMSRLSLQRALLGVLLAAAAAGTFFASMPWLRAYQVNLAPLLLVLSAGLPVLISVIVSRALRFAAGVSYATSLTGLVALLTISNGFNFDSIWNGLAHVPARLLTETLPLGGGSYLMAAPIVLTWLCGALSAELLLRPASPSAVGPGVPVVFFVLGFAATTSGPAGATIGEGAGLFGAFVVGALARQGLIDAQVAHADAGGPRGEGGLGKPGPPPPQLAAASGIWYRNGSFARCRLGDRGVARARAGQQARLAHALDPAAVEHRCRPAGRARLSATVRSRRAAPDGFSA